MNNSPRPPTAAACLEQVSELLTASQILVNRYLELTGENMEFVGNDIQLDLIAWADFLKTRPEFDALLMQVIE